MVYELNECRKVYGDRYIRVLAFDATPGWESCACPSSSTGRRRSPASASSARRPRAGRIRYTIQSYATDRPEGQRYA